MLKTNVDLGLLILRLWFGLEMAFAHGLPKFNKMLAGNFQFPDPLGVGNAFSLGLATFGELVCGLLIAAGLFTRLATIPYMITMFVAAFVIHLDDGWGKMASPLHYFIAALVLFITGPGRHSFDAWLERRSMA
jgi:putative oxidoreductase